MPPVVADTHTLLWSLFDSSRLSLRARSALKEAVRDSACIYVASISLVEIAYLSDRKRLTPEQVQLTLDELQRSGTAYKIVPLDLAVADALTRVPAHEVPEMADRIIAATALHLGIALVTRDRKIRAASIETIW